MVRGYLAHRNKIIILRLSSTTGNARLRVALMVGGVALYLTSCALADTRNFSASLKVMYITRLYTRLNSMKAISSLVGIKISIVVQPRDAPEGRMVGQICLSLRSDCHRLVDSTYTQELIGFNHV